MQGTIFKSMHIRLKDGENFNDTDDTIKKRIKTFNDETRPVIGDNSKVVVTVRCKDCHARTCCSCDILAKTK